MFLHQNKGIFANETVPLPTFYTINVLTALYQLLKGMPGYPYNGFFGTA